MNSANKSEVNTVFVTSIGITFAVIACGVIFPQQFGEFCASLKSVLTELYGWGYMLLMSLFVVFCIVVAFSRFGHVRLGADNARPEYKTISWLAMLFSAGMGIGLVFYGASEPLYHFATTPLGAEPNSVQAARDAIRISFFHWGLHPWAGYIVVALPLAYLQFRRGLPCLISSIFVSLAGEERTHGILGKIVDILAVFATLAGITTSLGLGAMMLNSGLADVFGIDKGIRVQMCIIALLGILYTSASALGIDKGIKKISDFNVVIFSALTVAMFIIGPTLSIIEAMITGVSDYLSGLISESLTLAPYGGDYEKFLENWTFYYWAWWISWAPFVGSFIARISKGRTIREFICCVLIIPALGSFTWFSVSGASGLYLELVRDIDVAQSVIGDISAGAFAVYSNYPFGSVLSVVLLVLVVTFFVAGASSGMFVLGMFTSHGNLNPPKSKMLMWGALMSAVAVVMLLTGGLNNLQTISLAAALPFSLIMLCSCAAFWKALTQEEEDSAKNGKY